MLKPAFVLGAASTCVASSTLHEQVSRFARRFRIALRLLIPVLLWSQRGLVIEYRCRAGVLL